MADNVNGLKTGIFGGAFNPVHNGHISLAENCISSLSLDRIIFIPTAQPPHKTSQHLVSKQDRLNMLSLALRDDERFEISDIEFNRQGKSYTYDTLVSLREMYPSDSFYLIIGSDQFLAFDKWYRYRDILSLAVLCTALRDDVSGKKQMLEFAEKLGILQNGGFSFIPGDVIQISSSEIRDMIKNFADISQFVPPAVNQYIAERKLYGV